MISASAFSQKGICTVSAPGLEPMDVSLTECSTWLLEDGALHTFSNGFGGLVEYNEHKISVAFQIVFEYITQSQIDDFLTLKIDEEKLEVDRTTFGTVHRLTSKDGTTLECKGIFKKESRPSYPFEKTIFDRHWRSPFDRQAVDTPF